MSSSNAYSSQSGSSQSGSSQTYSSQTKSSQMMNEDDCIMVSDADMLKSKGFDPLNALHEHNLASNPDLDVSCLSDDDFFATISSQMKCRDECIVMSDADMPRNPEFDPLNGLHEYNFATNPDLDESFLTDDEMIALMKMQNKQKTQPN